MKNFFIIHGANGGADASWGKWLKGQLEAFGEVISPSFPIAEEANPTSWKKVLDRYKDKISKDSVFICHSIGCLFIINYLAENNLQANRVVFVAGPGSEFISCDDEAKKEKLENIVRPFIPTPDTKDKFCSLVDGCHAIYSDNDHILSLDSLEAFAESVDAEKLLIKDKGHFGRKADIKEIPEILDMIKPEYKH